MTSMATSSVLIVDDEEDMRLLAGAVFAGSGFMVAAEAVDGPDALRTLEELAPPPVPTIVLLDNQMPGMSGLELAAQILDEWPEQIIVLFSAFLDARVRSEADRVGVSACVPKTEATSLPSVMTALLAQRR